MVLRRTRRDLSKNEIRIENGLTVLYGGHRQISRLQGVLRGGFVSCSRVVLSVYGAETVVLWTFMRDSIDSLMVYVGLQ